jgi:glycosyltransferase involved in cell wall biosynthesis
MKRILFFVSSMEGGGAERVAALLCNRWVALGHEVTLVPTFSGRGTCLYPLDSRVRLLYLADRVGTTRKTPLSMLRRLWAMRQMVGEARADAILSFLPHVNVAALVATRGLGVPVVVSERTYPPARPLGRVWPRLRRIAYPWATRVVMQTTGGRNWLAHEIPRARSVEIPNPCVFPLPVGEPKTLPQTIIPHNRRLLLAVGRLGEEKQFDVLIDAYTQLAPRFPDWDLAILGEGAERTALETQVAEVGLKGRVHLPGRVGNVGEWYDRADLYAMSSRFEGFPNTLLEALAHGVPAVSLDCATGPAEMIQDGVNGYLVKPEAGAEGLAARLGQLMADPARRAHFSKRALEVRERFSFDKVGVEWDSALGLRTRIR